MNCTFCGKTNSIIIYTENFQSTIRRVRGCQQCGHVWITLENSPIYCACGHDDSDVTSSERYEETVKRIRKCPKCRLVWKTYEFVIDDYSVIFFGPHEIEKEVFKRKHAQGEF